MNTQRIPDHRMIVRGALTALICGCWLLASGAAAQEATPRAAPATAPAKRVPPSRKPRREKVGFPTVYYLKHADAASIAQTLAKVAEARELDASFVPETRLNAIIVQASPEVHEQVEQLIKELDVAAVSAGERKDGKEDQEVRVQIYRLKYADAGRVLEMVSAVYAGKPIKLTADKDANSIIVAAAPEMQAQLGALIEQLDQVQERDADRELQIFHLKHADPDEAAAVISSLFDSNDARIAVDRRTNSVLVQAQREMLARIEAIFQKLDTPADKNLTRYDPGTTFRVRVVWLATIDADGPPDDLKDVVALLSKVGVKGLRQVGQVIVNTTPDGRFQVRCSPVLNKRPADLEISGEFDQQQETPTLKIELSASQAELPPATADGPPRRRGPEKKPLVDLQTVIAAPLGHYVVLGVAPVEKMTSVFIVQVTAGK